MLLSSTVSSLIMAKESRESTLTIQVDKLRSNTATSQGKGGNSTEGVGVGVDCVGGASATYARICLIAFYFKSLTSQSFQNYGTLTFTPLPPLRLPPSSFLPPPPPFLPLPLPSLPSFLDPLSHALPPHKPSTHSPIKKLTLLTYFPVTS